MAIAAPASGGGTQPGRRHCGEIPPAFTSFNPGYALDRAIAEHKAMDMLVNIDVDDLAKAVAFYAQAAGLRPGRSFGALGVEMLGASSPVYLLVKGAGTSPSPRADEVRHYRRHWTPVHLDFVVADLAAAVACALAAGATIEGEIETHPWGRIARMADPFGHGLCFIAFLGRSYDEIAGRQQDGA
jgi:predicted enzyme related to lactoylglutathione lyase